MKKRLKTIHGQTATRRIKWFQPHYDILDGKKIVDVLVMLEVTFGPEPYRLVYAGAQFGLDKRGKLVLPGGQVVNTCPHMSVGFNFAVPLATVMESVEKFVHDLNRKCEAYRQNQNWWTPAGVQRGEIHSGILKQDAALNLGINPVHIA